jgi:hypothetical protein
MKNQKQQMLLENTGLPKKIKKPLEKTLIL